MARYLEHVVDSTLTRNTFAVSQSINRAASMPCDADLRPDAIIHEIEHAFAAVCLGDGVTLHEADVIDDYGSAEERQAARALDTDERWQDVPGADIEAFPDTLCFVDRKGVAYYLPAYMVWSLRHYKTSHSLSSDHPIYSLTLGEDESLRDWHLDRFHQFNEQQSRSICRFLRFMATQENNADAVAASKALAQCWGKFCESIG